MVQSLTSFLSTPGALVFVAAQCKVYDSSIHLQIIWMGGPSVQSGGRSGTISFANYMDHKDGLAVTKRQSIFSNSIEKSDVGK